MQRIIDFFKKYPLALAIFYTVFHFIVFFILEAVIEPKFIINCFIDDYIPFCEYFILPYLLWFLYIPAVVLYLIKYDVKSYWKLVIMLFGGNIICLVLYMIFPNSVVVKEAVPDNNIFCTMVNMLYANDTPTNVCPSMHVLDTFAAHIALAKSPTMKNRRRVTLFSLVFLILICIATVTLKQHSIIDVFASFILIFILWKVAYRH